MDHLKDCIGERLISVTEPWDGECEEGDMILEFESRSFYIVAMDYSEPGRGGSPALRIIERGKDE